MDAAATVAGSVDVSPVPIADEQWIVADDEWELGNALPLIEVRATGALAMRRVDERWALDCTHGNHFSQLNHSCRANCYLRISGHRVEVYSLGAIRAGDELTVDYGETMHPNGMGCRCGVPGCRSRI